MREIVSPLAGLRSPFGSRRAGGGGEAAITIADPTFAIDFATVADGTRLVAGDPNANYGLGATNPGNLGWDALTTVAPTNARYNPVVFQGFVRQRTANGAGDFTAPGTYLLAPAGLTQTGAQYGQATVNVRAEASRFPGVTLFGTDQANRMTLELSTSLTGAGGLAVQRVSGGATSSVVSASPGVTRVRRGGLNGQYAVFDAIETVTLLAVGDRAYMRRAPGFPLGPTAGTAYTSLAGDRFGLPSLSQRPNWVGALRVGSAPLFITVDETHRFWVPKKRASSSDPITAGVGDETFTGTYVGTIPSKMQWALFDMGTGAVIKDWATVPTADFTAGSGTWSARLRAIPSGLNGRGAYAVGFRPVDATDQTDPAWQVVSNREFYVTLNVGVIGQSNAVFLTNPVTGSNYARVDGIMSYTKADPPSVVQGAHQPEPRFWADTSATGANSVGNGRCTYLLGDYLANLYDLPISFEVLAISANGATNLGPNGANWSYIQTHHAFAGGAYDILYLSQGENEFASSPGDWLTTWRDINIPAYRDPAFHGQPAGTVIPLLYTITGRFTGVPGGTDANAQTLRSAQYSLESEVSDCYLAHSYTGVEMIDTFHYVATNGEGYNEVARRIRLTYDHVFNAGAYDGRGPVATSASRAAAVITVSFDLNGATSLTTRDGRDQTLSGTAATLTSWQVSADDFATTLTITSAVQTGNTVVITLSADPGGPVRVRNHFGLNPDLTHWVSGSYADGTFIGMMPLVNALVTT